MKKTLIIASLISLMMPLSAFASTIQIVMASDGPSASDVAINSDDVILNKIIFTTDGDIVVEEFTIDVNATGDGLIDSTGNVNFKDWKLVEYDSSWSTVIGTLMGPVSLDPGGSDSSQTLKFTDYWNASKGTATYFAITCDIVNNVALDGSTISADFGPVDSATGIRDMIYGDYVTDIVPSVALTGYPMTILAPALDISLASSPVSDTIYSGDEDVNVVSFNLEAGSASDLTVTDIELTAYVDDDIDGVFVQGVDNSVYADDILGDVWIENADGDVLGTEAITSAGVVEFSSISWDIDAGNTDVLKVYSDIEWLLPFGGDDDAFSFDVTDVLVEDADGNSITPSGLDANGASTPYVVMTVTEPAEGVLTVAEDASSPDDSAVVAGEEDVHVASFRVAAYYEDFDVDDITFTVNDPSVVDQIVLNYPSDPSDLTTYDAYAVSALAGDEAVFNSLGLTVPINEYVVVDVYVDFADHILDGGSVSSGDSLELTLESYDFQATGQNTGVIIDEDDISDVEFSGTTYVYRSVPTFSSSTGLGSSLILGAAQEIYRFNVTADNNGDVLLGNFAFDLESSGVNMSSFYITEYGSSRLIGRGRYMPLMGILNVNTARIPSRIAAGSTKTYSVYADVYDADSSVSNEAIAIKVHEDDYASVGTVRGVKASLGGYGTIWSDLGSLSGAFGKFVPQWISNYATPGMPLSYTTLN